MKNSKNPIKKFLSLILGKGRTTPTGKESLDEEDMQECIETRELASDYLDEDIDDSHKARLRNHLLRCHGCKAFIDTLKRTISLLASLPKAEPPESSIEEIKKRTET